MKLSKTLIFGAALVYGTQVMASAVTPTAPTPPTIVTTSPNATEANAVSTTNKVYIDQSGQNVDVNLVQTGTSNIIGSVLDPIYLRGDNQDIIAVQTGNGNQLYLSAVSNVGGNNSSAVVTLRQIGNLNTATIRCGEEIGDVACNLLNMNAKFTGNSNRFAFNGSGANIRNSMDIIGNNNEFDIDVSAPNSSQTILVTGSYNIFDATQTGTAGTYGHSLRVDLTGSLNTVTTQQYGASETVINVKAIGSNGLYNIKTGQ